MNRCQNCNWTGSDEELDNVDNIPDIHERVAPGEPMPSGECPECGALCQPIANPSGTEDPTDAV